MGIYSDYISKKLTFEEITKERKEQLNIISTLRKRDIIVYASDFNKGSNPISINPADFLPFKDQLSNIKTENVDLILETPGGIAETVEDMVELLRSKHNSLGIIIPGMAKSAGTIFAMAGDEILMNNSSALGPIDAQVLTNGKRFSADAFLDGLQKIKEEVSSTGRLNPAYIPMLQNISPGEIQHFENAQFFSQTLVRKWLSKYKFKFWNNHSSTGLSVTVDEKESRAQEIASKLCKHSDWLTHGRSIRINDLEAMKLQIFDYSNHSELNDAIEKYYTLLRITFDMTGIYKIFETKNSQIYQSVSQSTVNNIGNAKNASIATVKFKCPKCSSHHNLQLNLEDGIKIEKDCIEYPKNDIFVCPNCNTESNVSPIRLQVEAQTGKKVIF